MKRQFNEVRKLALSRGSEIDTQLCVKNSGTNIFGLVLIATVRAREIREQHKESEKREHIFPIIPALQEIQEGKIGKDYLDRIK